MTVKIAFATSDRRAVNQHFGAAESFAVYEIGESETRLIEVAEFIETAMDGHEGKLAAKVELLAQEVVEWPDPRKRKAKRKRKARH